MAWPRPAAFHPRRETRQAFASTQGDKLSPAMLRPFEAERERHNGQVGCALIVQA
jgi:hypothetical protein